MKNVDDESFLRALLGSAGPDGPPPGARTRALVALREDATGAWARSRDVGSALAALLLVGVLGAGVLGRPIATDERAARVPAVAAHASAGERGSFSAAGAACAGGVESPASSCEDVRSGAIGSSSGSLSSSSGGISGSSSSG